MKKYHTIILIVDDDANDLILLEESFRATSVTNPNRDGIPASYLASGI